MNNNYASCKYIVTSVTLYRSSLVDLRHSRTVHSVDNLPCLLDPRTAGRVDCCAVHYGFCLPVVVRLNPVRLLAVPGLEADLERLVTKFVAEDKARLAARRAAELPMLTVSTASPSASGQNSPASPPSTFPTSPTSHLSSPSIQTKGTTRVKTHAKKSPNDASAPKIVAKDSLYGYGNSTLPGISKSGRDTSISNEDSSNNTWPALKKTSPKTVKNQDLGPDKGLGSPTSNVTKVIVPDSKHVVACSDVDDKGADTKKTKIQKKNNNKSSASKAELKSSLQLNGNDVVSTKGSLRDRAADERAILQEELDKILKFQETPEDVELHHPLISPQQITIQVERSPTSSPTLMHDADGLSLKSSSKSPVFIENHVLSPVDYAKTRFQNFQNFQSQQLKGDDTHFRLKNGSTQLVTEAKHRFENGQIHNAYDKWRPEWVPGQHLLDMEAGMVQAAVDALKRDAKHQRLRKASSPEPAGAPPILPHPKLTSMQKQHIRERSLSPTGFNTHVPIRPFLTKGSVAERVLIFERCPTSLEREQQKSVNVSLKTKQPLVSTWRTEVQSKTQTLRDKESRDALNSPRNTLRRLGKSVPQNLNIPRFYFPNGRPEQSKDTEKVLQRIATVFSNLEGGHCTREQFGVIAKACDLPLYWKMPLFVAAGGEKKGFITSDMFLEFWKKLTNNCHDESSKFIFILTKGNRNYLVPEDFVPLIQDVVDTHPGLTFLKEAVEFHSRYVHTVIARIYYCVNRSWSGRIVASELRKSNFLQILALLEEEDDINQITEYFSYEHFYVIYCKFWELDKDHDLYIDKNDLRCHNDHAISSRMIDRIFSGAVTRGRAQKEQKMSYTEFVWFLISEEDKRHPTSIEYWFRCMDIDGDGFLSMYELEFFYEEQLQRMEALGIETLPFKDCLCQMLDMIRPKTPGLITLADLKMCRMTPIFFDTFFNLEKYLDHEQRDPFASQRDHDSDGPDISDWDRYAAEEYEFLVAEEGANDQQDHLGHDDDYEHDEDDLSPNLDKLTINESIKRKPLGNGMDLEDDYADYADYADSDDYQY